MSQFTTVWRIDQILNQSIDEDQCQSSVVFKQGGVTVKYNGAIFNANCQVNGNSIQFTEFMKLGSSGTAVPSLHDVEVAFSQVTDWVLDGKTLILKNESDVQVVLARPN